MKRGGGKRREREKEKRGREEENERGGVKGKKREFQICFSKWRGLKKKKKVIIEYPYTYIHRAPADGALRKLQNYLHGHGWFYLYSHLLNRVMID